VRSKVQSTISPSVFRRFNSDEAKPIERELESAEAAVESSEEAKAGAAEAERHFIPASETDATSNDGFRNGEYRSDQPPHPNPRPDRVTAPCSSIYIGNLLFEATAADIEKEFAQFGKVKAVTIATDQRGLSKGFGFLEFETVEQARAAIAAKDESVYEGRRLVVNYQVHSSRHPPPKGESRPSKTLFIGNLAYELSDADLNKLFRDIRNVLDVRVAIDRRTGQPRGFAHADFVDIESATQGLQVLDGKEVHGRKLRVDYSAFREPQRRSVPGGDF